MTLIFARKVKHDVKYNTCTFLYGKYMVKLVLNKIEEPRMEDIGSTVQNTEIPTENPNDDGVTSEESTKAFSEDYLCVKQTWLSQESHQKHTILNLIHPPIEDNGVIPQMSKGTRPKGFGDYPLVEGLNTLIISPYCLLK